MPEVTITIRPAGPYLVKGPVEIRDADGNVLVGGTKDGKDDVALCRCGGSTTKPFCDGTHSKIGFMAAQQAVKSAE